MQPWIYDLLLFVSFTCHNNIYIDTKFPSLPFIKKCLCSCAWEAGKDGEREERERSFITGSPPPPPCLQQSRPVPDRSWKQRTPSGSPWEYQGDKPFGHCLLLSSLCISRKLVWKQSNWDSIGTPVSNVGISRCRLTCSSWPIGMMFLHIFTL